jgi:hypothetical protein
MLNFAEQTGSGAVIVVWSFLSGTVTVNYTKSCVKTLRKLRKFWFPSALSKENVAFAAATPGQRLPLLLFPCWRSSVFLINCFFTNYFLHRLRHCMVVTV